MIVEIKNFGPIESFTFDLNKDLHFIIGKNGVGKSYASYCLYCIFKHLYQWNIQNPYIYGFNNEYGDQLTTYSEKIISELKKVNEFDISIFVSDFVKTLLSKSFIPSLKNSLLNTFSSINNLKNQFSNEYFSIRIKNDEFNVLISSDSSENIDVTSIEMSSKIKVVKNKKARVNFTVLVDDVHYSKVNKGKLSEELANLINLIVKNFFHFSEISVKEVIFLPSSRSGLYQALNSFSSILAELAQNRFLLKNRKIELPALSEPLSDYFIDISILNKRHINKNLIKIVSNFEEILQGSVDYDQSTNRIIYRPDKINLALDLSEASSMVSELSPIVLILKHVVNYKSRQTLISNFIARGKNPKDINSKPQQTLLFIEEPEAHVHPEVQIQLMELFVNLIAFDIKLVITSHSNYMFNALNNLILDQKVEASRVGMYHLIKTENGSIVNPESLATEDGIMDENFAHASEQLFEERINILERQNGNL